MSAPTRSVPTTAAAFVRAKADAYADEFGSVDPETNTLEFGRGVIANAKEDHYHFLLELADELEVLEQKQIAETLEPRYYLQDSRSFVGNCPTWWRPGGCGYTTDLNDAARYTFAEAMRRHQDRDTDIPWLCSEIDPLRRSTVDHQYMPRSKAMQLTVIKKLAKQGGAA